MLIYMYNFNDYYLRRQFLTKKMLGKSQAKKLWAKNYKKCDFSIHRKSKNVHILRHSGRRKKCDIFWNLDMLRSNEKKNMIKIRPQIKKLAGGGRKSPW